MKIKKILVPLDFSEYSDRAIDVALFLAEQFKDRITLMHVVTLFNEDVNENKKIEKYKEIVSERESWIHKKMQHHAEKAGERGITIDSILLRGFSAGETILEYLKDNDYDLVVMGSHGRTGIKHFLYGSISEKVVRLSTVPVLTVHEDGKEFNPKKILVPVDFSIHSKKAIEHAFFFGRLFNSELTFIHIIERFVHPAFYSSDLDTIPKSEPELKARARENLEKFIGKTELSYKYLVVEGNAYREIVNHANENKMDLIILATRGLSGLEYFLMGSTAQRVVRLAKCPVMTIATGGNTE